jgi:hypothetical protein
LRDRRFNLIEEESFIKNEEPILPGEVGIERAAFVLKNVRAELLEGK